MYCAAKTLQRFALLAVLLTACQGAVTPAPTPTPQPVGVTPLYLEWASDSLSTYQDMQAGIFFSLDIYPREAGLAALQEGELELLISAVEPLESYFMTPLLKDGIAVIHHGDLELDSMTLDELRSIFSGAEQNWLMFGGEDLPINPVIPLPGDDLRTIFQQRVMEGFQFSSLAQLQATPGQILKLVQEKPGAIGFVPFTALEDDIPVLSIEGQAPSQRSIENGGYPLLYWVAGIALEEPGGALRDWIVWVQTQD
jgi:hypothetical protein